MSAFDMDIFDEDEWGLGRPMWDAARGCLEPLAEITETPESVVVTVDLPYTSKDSVKIDASEDSITIEAQTRRRMRFERWGTVQRETEFCYYRKTLPLPKKVDPTRAKATYRSGVLQVVLPKVVKLHRITID